MTFIYLASPYSSRKEDAYERHLEEEERYLHAEVATAKLLKDGEIVYSPIVHCHNLAVSHNMPKDAAFWQHYNYAMLDAAKSFMILQIEGWTTSSGVKGELEYAIELGLPTYGLKAKPFRVLELTKAERDTVLGS